MFETAGSSGWRRTGRGRTVEAGARDKGHYKPPANYVEIENLSSVRLSITITAQLEVRLTMLSSGHRTETIEGHFIHSYR